MIRIVAIIILAVLGPACQAAACDTRSGSTFCADGWVALPVADPGGPDPAQADAWRDNGGGADPFLLNGEGIHVEGAVPVDSPIPSDGDPP